MMPSVFSCGEGVRKGSSKGHRSIADRWCGSTTAMPACVRLRPGGRAHLPQQARQQLPPQAQALQLWHDCHVVHGGHQGRVPHCARKAHQHLPLLPPRGQHRPRHPLQAR